MYKCSECGAVFEDLAECHQEGGCYEADFGVYSDFPDHHYYPAVDYIGCPECGADEDCCDELVECDRCSTFVEETYETVFGSLCDNCYDDLFEEND